MQNRLQQFLDKKKLSPAKFAKIVGVDRSAVSHILSGRNNPRLDYIQKILQNFPDLNSDWLILGTGDMFKTETVKKANPTENKQETKQEQILFEEEDNSVLIETQNDEPPASKEIPVINQENNSINSNNIKNDEVNSENSNNNVTSEKNDNYVIHRNKKTIERIVIFNSEGTFKEYLPEKS